MARSSSSRFWEQPRRRLIAAVCMLFFLLMFTVGDLISPPPWPPLSDPGRGWRVVTFMAPQGGLFAGAVALLQRSPWSFWLTLLGLFILQTSRFMSLDGGGGAWPHLLVRLVGFSIAAGALWYGFIASGAGEAVS